MAFNEYAEFDAIGLAELVQKREVSPSELVEEAISRIEAFNPAVNAVVYKAYDLARSIAAAQDKSAPTGPLHGVPFLLKDILGDCQGLPSTLASRMLRERVMPQDCELVSRFRKAGLVFVGKSNSPEFGILPTTECAFYGPARNPWNLDHGPGGSSGGSAAAIAAGIVPIALGGDGGGSIRIPASACGLIGLKPSRGRISLAPLTQHWFGLVVLGGLARSVLDSAILLDVLSGSLPTDRWQLAQPPEPYATTVDRDPGLLRIGWTTKPVQPGVLTNREVVRATAAFMADLAILGHDVREGSPRFPLVHDAFLPQFFAGIRVEADLVEHPERLEQRTKDIVRLSGWATDAVVDRALRRGERIAEAVDAYVLGSADIVAYPVMPVPVPPVGRAVGQGGVRSLITSLPLVTNTTLANVTGHPSISLPAGLDGNGVPIGVQLMARRGREDLLLSVAAQLERLQPGGAWPLAPLATADPTTSPG